MECRSSTKDHILIPASSASGLLPFSRCPSSLLLFLDSTLLLHPPLARSHESCVVAYPSGGGSPSSKKRDEIDILCVDKHFRATRLHFLFSKSPFTSPSFPHCSLRVLLSEHTLHPHLVSVSYCKGVCFSPRLLRRPTATRQKLEDASDDECGLNLFLAVRGIGHPKTLSRPRQLRQVVLTKRQSKGPQHLVFPLKNLFPVEDNPIVA